jgi:hypothetical protein
VTDGLIISSNRAVFDEFNMNFSSELTNFEYAQSVHTAQEALEWEMFDYLLIIEEKIEDVQLIMQNLQRSAEFIKLPVLCCTANTDLTRRELLWKTMVKDIIFLPVSKEEFRLQLDSFLRSISVVEKDQQITGMQGKLEDYNLLDLIQTLDQNKKTGILTMYHGRDEGRIWFMNGRTCEAEFRTFENLAAVFKLVTWLEGDFTISFVEEEYEPKLEQDNQQILLECIQYIDHRNKLIDTLPDLNELLLISPETDIVQMETEQANYLRFFQGGQTISGFLSAFDQDELKLLEIIKGFIEKQHLMTRDIFDSYRTEQEREVGQTGFKNVFKKLFRGKEGGTNKTPTKLDARLVKTTSASAAGESEKTLADKGLRYDYLFMAENANLIRFREKIEKV